MSEASNQPILRLQGVRKEFGNFVAVHELNLSVPTGVVYGFLGPNGAGKTTSLRMITGLLRPTAGSVEVCGVDAIRNGLEAKRRVGFIGDRPFLYEKLTGAEFLRFVGGLWGMSKHEIRERGDMWLERFELFAWRGEPIDAFSHGMRQRLLICSALMHQPQLLIMDEPMVGLDPRGAAQLKKVVRELVVDGAMSVVLSTHTLDLVEQVCDAVAIIDKGRVIAEGSVDSIRQKYDLHGARLEDVFLQITGKSAAVDGRRIEEDA